LDLPPILFQQKLFLEIQLFFSLYKYIFFNFITIVKVIVSPDVL
jgi:hypothetical protein